MILPDGVDLAHVRARAARIRRPNVTITAPPSDVVLERDVPVAVRDGTILRVNVFRPEAPGRYPVIMCAHPYGKDSLPKAKGSAARRRYAVPFQLRMLPQSEPFTFSAWTSWEGPDPGWWVPRGYVVVNCDLRGWGHSDGTGELLSAQEGLDYHDLVEWAGTQAWSNGRVGLLGVSYLALSQWAAAAERPPHLAAICPWEGFTDAYRDFIRPGGVRERGFLRLWQTILGRQGRSPVHLVRESQQHPVFDEWWAARNREIERIDVPALVCASFSDHNLHSRGSFEGFRRLASRDKWLYTHRGGKWATFYSDPARAHQARFLDHFLRGDGTEAFDEPRVRVEVREDAATVGAVYGAPDWPPPGTRWTPLHLTASGRLDAETSSGPGTVPFSLRRGRARFAWTFPDDVDLVGPMWLRLCLELRGADDACVFAGVRKRRNGRWVGFEGSYGFDRALVTLGMGKPSLRAVDPERSLPGRPFRPCTQAAPLRPGEVVTLDLDLAAQATRFRAGEELVLDVQGRWFFPTNPIVGQFPARYERSPKGTGVLHVGGIHDSALHIPVRSD